MTKVLIVVFVFSVLASAQTTAPALPCGDWEVTHRAGALNGNYGVLPADLMTLGRAVDNLAAFTVSLENDAEKNVALLCRSITMQQIQVDQLRTQLAVQQDQIDDFKSQLATMKKQISTIGPKRHDASAGKAAEAKPK